MLCRVIAKNVGDVFLRHSVDIATVLYHQHRVTVNYSDLAIFSTTVILLTLLIDDCGKNEHY